VPSTQTCRTHLPRRTAVSIGCRVEHRVDRGLWQLSLRLQGRASGAPGRQAPARLL